MVGLTFNKEGWRPLYPFESQAFYLPSGPRMHYLDEGQGEPILALHGNPTWSFFYRELVKAYRGKYRVIVPDHIGCGLSEKPQEYDYCLRTHIDNLAQLIEALHLEPFNLVVHDWGGAIGMGYAVEHPEMVKRILFLNTAAYRSQHMPRTIALARIPYLGEFLVRGLNAFVLGALFTGTKRPLGTCDWGGYIYPYGSWKERIAVARFVQDIPMKPGDRSYDLLKSIEEKLPLLQDKPMSFVWGGLDHVFNDHFLNDWKRIFPQADFTRLSDAGHMVMDDASMLVQEHFDALLAKEV